MNKKHVIIISFLVIVFLFVKFVPNAKTFIEIKQYEKTEKSYSESHNDEILAELVFEAANNQYYYKLQEYGKIFFENRNPYSVCNLLEEYMLLNSHNFIKDCGSSEELYDIILWQYLITYFYDTETGSLTNIVLFLNKYEKLENHFIATYEKNFDKLHKGIICTEYFKYSESLKNKFLNALNLHWLINNTANAYDTVLFSASETDDTKQNDLYMDIILFESGKDLWKTNHITISNEIDNSVFCRSSIEFIEHNSHISEIADLFKVNLDLSELDAQDIFVFTTNNYAYVYFGENASIFMCYDLNNGDLIEYKSSL